MKNVKNGQRVDVFVVQYENIFEKTGRTELLVTSGVIRKSTKLYSILEDASGRLHFISFSKYKVRARV